MYFEVQRLIIDTQPTIIQYFRRRRHFCIMQSTGSTLYSVHKISDF